MRYPNTYATNIGWQIGIILLLFSFLFMFFTSQCSPLYIYNDWSDPHIYFSMGKGAVNGEVLYRDIFDHKGPIIFFIYGIGYLISTSNLVGVYVLESIILFINLCFAYKLANLFLEQKAAFIVSLIYALLVSHKTETGGSADEFISPAVTISFYYFTLYFRQPDNQSVKLNKYLLIHGIMFGWALLIKFSACVFWMPLLLGIYIHLIGQKQYRKAIIGIGYFIIGCLIPAIPVILYFAANSAMPDFIWGYFEFNLMYVNTDISVVEKVTMVAERFIKSIIFDYVFYGVLLFGIFTSVFSNRLVQSKIYKISIGASFILTYLLIAGSPYNMNYAYIILAVFALPGIIYLAGLVNKDMLPKVSRNIVYAIVFVLILSVGIFNKRFFNRDITCLFQKDKCGHMQQTFADIIKQEDNPTLLNLDLDYGIGTVANVVPRYKYFFHPIISDESFPELRASQIELIKSKQPTFIISPFDDFPYLKENYDMVADSSRGLYLYKRKKE